MALSFAGCGGGNASPSAISATEAPSVTTAMPTPAIPATTGAASSQSAAHPLWTDSAPPLGGASVPGARWVRFPGPGAAQLYAAVFTPSGAGPFPAVVFAHGTEGLRTTHEIQLAADVSAAGDIVTVAVCWFSGNWNVGADYRNPYAVTYADGVSCPDAPSIGQGNVVETANTPGTQGALDAIVRMTRTLPAVDAQRVGLFGHSRGSAAVLVYGAQTGGVTGVVAAAGYPLLTPAIIHSRPPLLILQGTADSQVDAARQFESGVRAGGWRVSSHYYAGADHYLFYNAPTHADVVARIAAFFR